MRARRISLAFVTLLAISALLAPAVAQDKPVQLKLSHWVPPSHPLQKALEDWGGSIQKATNGSVTFTFFPSQQLGKAFDTTTWRATASPMSPTSARATSPAASPSSTPAISP